MNKWQHLIHATETEQISHTNRHFELNVSADVNTVHINLCFMNEADYARLTLFYVYFSSYSICILFCLLNWLEFPLILCMNRAMKLDKRASIFLSFSCISKLEEMSSTFCDYFCFKKKSYENNVLSPFLISRIQDKLQTSSTSLFVQDGLIKKVFSGVIAVKTLAVCDLKVHVSAYVSFTEELKIKSQVNVFSYFFPACLF